ncbi:MAG: DegT/DnrJ/EryC1/StrS aminotransferase family protein [Nitrospira sp.]|nr:DegT/DnrJ/EryC1/StrS aminotransferase family protein [Nitrospira sp.]
MESTLPFTRPSLDEETVQAVSEVLHSGWITSGPKVLAFEEALSTYLGGNRMVRALNSGTSALELALSLCHIGPGDEVIVPAISFACSANVILRAGARPVFVDVDLTSRNLKLDQVATVITKRTKAIMPVHFAGLPVDMDALYRLAGQHHLRVIEDAAHAIGSGWGGRKIGGFGDLVCFSFHPNKNITTIEGGALSVGDPELVPELERLRFHGIARDAQGSIDVVVAGGKYNLSDVSACIGLHQLRHLDEFVARRAELVGRYFTLLGDRSGLVLPARGDQGHSWNMFTVLIPFAELGIERSAFQQAMAARGISIGIHYPAIPGFSLYQSFGYRVTEFPNAQRIGRETVTLPLFPAMTQADVERVCSALIEVLDSRS